MSSNVCATLDAGGLTSGNKEGTVGRRFAYGASPTRDGAVSNEHNELAADCDTWTPIEAPGALAEAQSTLSLEER